MPAPRPNPAAGAILAVVAGAMFMEMLDSTIILTALPRMAQAFGTTAVALSLGITAYLLALAALLPASGWLADRFGTRDVFAAAIAVFTLASILCGLSHSLGQFAAMRALQGAAAAMMSPVGRVALLRDTERSRLARAMNIAITAALLGPSVGPPLGGFLTTYASWRWIFFINVPIGVLGALLVWRLFPNHRSAARTRFDGAGFVLNALAMLGVLYGMQLLAEGGDWRAAVALIGAGVGVGALAVRHALRRAHPLLELAALKLHAFATTAISGSLIRVAVFVPQFALPLLLQLGLGMSPFVSGLYILLHAGADLATKAVVVRTLRGFGFRRVLLASALAFAACLVGLATVGGGSSRVLLAALLVLAGIARSYQMGALITLQFAEVPAPLMTGASTLSAVLQQIAQALAVALAALMLQAALWWRHAAPGALMPADFHLAFLLAACLAVVALRWHLALRPDAGAEVSGHAPAR